jgi:hypothetical protein
VADAMRAAEADHTACFACVLTLNAEQGRSSL